MSSTAENLQRYYRFQSRIYDETRWTFLFGRGKILKEVARRAKPKRILEVGCGTGTNLITLAELFPDAEITGMDLSGHMLEKARKKLARFENRVRLIAGAYGQVEIEAGSFDLVLFSYCLSMVNPGYQQLVSLALKDLAPQGAIAIVDFHDTPWEWFRRWMGVNHVRFDGQILKAMQEMEIKLELCDIRRAYFGLWRFLLSVGSKSNIVSSA